MLTAVIGLRFEVGTDWGNYIALYFRPAANADLSQVLLSPDPGFVLLNWFANQVRLDYWFVNVCIGLLFVAGLIRFVRRLPEPLIGFTAAIPYLCIVVAMNYTRQAGALGVLLLAFPYLYDGKLVKYAFCVFIASTIHQSAIIFLPLAIIARTERKSAGLLVVGGFMLAGVGFFILQSRLEAWWYMYLYSPLANESQGAVVRVAMVALPAAVFLFIAKRIQLGQIERRIWSVLSIFALLAMIAVFSFPTAVDRLALYLAPIQLVVAAHFLQLVRRSDRVLPRLGVLGVYALVQYMWLAHAAHSSDWLPYRAWPFFSMYSVTYL